MAVLIVWLLFRPDTGRWFRPAGAGPA
jgi:hypothetical protein